MAKRTTQAADPSPALLRQPKVVEKETLEASGGYVRHSAGETAKDVAAGLNTAPKQRGGSGTTGNRTRTSTPPKIAEVPGLVLLGKARTPKSRSR